LVPWRVVSWHRSVAGFACEAFTGRSSVTLRRRDKETPVRKMRLGWSVLGGLLGAAHMHSEHAN
jgi:hypothetical protein